MYELNLSETSYIYGGTSCDAAVRAQMERAHNVGILFTGVIDGSLIGYGLFSHMSLLSILGYLSTASVIAYSLGYGVARAHDGQAF